MQPTIRAFRSWFPSSCRRRVRQIALAAATAVCLAAHSWVAQAAPMNYAITAPGALATFNAGAFFVDITGNFTIDPDTLTESNVVLFLSPRDAGSPILPGTYLQTDPLPMPTSTSIIATFAQFLVPYTIELQWQTLSPGNNPPPPTLIFIGSVYNIVPSILNGNSETLGGTLTGFATVTVGTPAPVPEPASLTLLCAAVGVFLGIARASRRRAGRASSA